MARARSTIWLRHGRRRLGAGPDVADREGAGGVEALQLDPVQPDRHDVEGAVLVRLDLGQLHPAPDPEQRLGAVVPDLVALPDPDRAEHPVRGVGYPRAGGGRAPDSGPRTP